MRQGLAGMVRDRLGQASFGTHVAKLMSGTVSVLALNLAISPILTRLYSPKDFGVLSVFTALVSALTVLTCMGFDRAIVLPKDDDDAAAVLGIALVSATGVTFVCAVTVWQFGPRITTLFHADALGPYLWLLPASLIGVAAYQGLLQWAMRRQQYGLIAKTRVAQGLSQAIGQLGLGLALAGPVGLLIGDALSRVSGATTFASQSWSNEKSTFRRLRRERMKAVGARFKGFATFSTLAALLHLSATALPPLLLATLYSTESSGFYNLGQKVIWVPMTVLSGAVAQVFIGEAAKAARDNRSKLSGLVAKTTRTLFWIGLGPMLLLSFVGGPLFAAVFGARWHEAGVYMQIIAATQLIQFVVGPVFQVLNVLERPRVILACDLFGFVCIVGGMWGAKAAGLSERWAVAAYGLGTVILYGALYITSVRAVKGHPL